MREAGEISKLGVILESLLRGKDPLVESPDLREQHVKEG